MSTAPPPGAPSASARCPVCGSGTDVWRGSREKSGVRAFILSTSHFMHDVMESNALYRRRVFYYSCLTCVGSGRGGTAGG